MIFLKLVLTTLFLLQSSNALATLQIDTSSYNELKSLKTDEGLRPLSPELIELIKDMSLLEETPQENIELNNLSVEGAELCGKYYDYLVSISPKNWRNSSRVTAASAKKIAILYNACLEKALK